MHQLTSVKALLLHPCNYYVTMTNPVVLSLDDLTTVRSSALLTDAPPAALDDLLTDAMVSEFRNHQLVFRPDDLADRIFLVLKGKVQIYRGETAGKHAVLAVQQRGAAFGLEDAFEQGHHLATAQAVGDCRVLEFSAAAYRRVVGENSSMAIGLVKYLSQSLLSVSDQLERIQLKPTTQRLADYLLRLPANGSDNGEITLPYEKALIAAYLGMEPESLSRALKDLQAVGVSNRGRRVHIKNEQALREFCRASPGPVHA